MGGMSSLPDSMSQESIKASLMEVSEQFML